MMSMPLTLLILCLLDQLLLSNPFPKTLRLKLKLLLSELNSKSYLKENLLGIKIKFNIFSSYKNILLKVFLNYLDKIKSNKNLYLINSKGIYSVMNN